MSMVAKMKLESEPSMSCRVPYHCTEDEPSSFIVECTVIFSKCKLTQVHPKHKSDQQVLIIHLINPSNNKTCQKYEVYY